MNKIVFRVLTTIIIMSMLALTVFAAPVTASAVAPDLGRQNQPAPMSVTLITDQNGFKDHAFNDAALKGLKRADAKFKVETVVLESHSAQDYPLNLSIAAIDAPDLIISVGFTLDEDTSNAAIMYPDQNFAIIDPGLEDFPSNVASLKFKEQEGAFLVGVIAGLTTETNLIGFVGGMRFDVIEKFEYGFKAGVEAVNPGADVVSNYLAEFDYPVPPEPESDESDYIAWFNRPDLGEEVAMYQFGEGADVIFHAAGYSGNGVITAAGENGFWAIGVDQDQSYLDPEAVLCSMVKRVDNMTYYAIKLVVEEKWEGLSLLEPQSGPTIEFGIAEKAVGYSDDANNVPEEVAAVVKEYENAISRGTIVVPYDSATYEAYDLAL